MALEKVPGCFVKLHHLSQRPWVELENSGKESVLIKLHIHLNCLLHPPDLKELPKVDTGALQEASKRIIRTPKMNECRLL